MEIGEVVNGGHDIHLHNIPSCSEERTHEPIWPWCLVIWRIKHNTPSFIHGERGAKISEITFWVGNTIPINVPLSLRTLIDDKVEVIMDDGLLVIMIIHPTRIVLQTMAFFSFSGS